MHKLYHFTITLLSIIIISLQIENLTTKWFTVNETLTSYYNISIPTSCEKVIETTWDVGIHQVANDITLTNQIPNYKNPECYTMTYEDTYNNITAISSFIDFSCSFSIGHSRTCNDLTNPSFYLEIISHCIPATIAFMGLSSVISFISAYRRFPQKTELTFWKISLVMVTISFLLFLVLTIILFSMLIDENISFPSSEPDVIDMENYEANYSIDTESLWIFIVNCLFYVILFVMSVIWKKTLNKVKEIKSFIV